MKLSSKWNRTWCIFFLFTVGILSKYDKKETWDKYCKFYYQANKHTYSTPTNPNANLATVNTNIPITLSFGEQLLHNAAEEKYIRYVDRKGLVNEDNNEYVQIAKESISTMRQNLKRLSGAKSYAKAVDTIDAMNTLTLSEDENDFSNLFTEKHVDNAVETAFPKINRLINIQRSVADYIENSIENSRFSVPAINEEVVDFPIPPFP